MLPANKALGWPTKKTRVQKTANQEIYDIEPWTRPLATRGNAAPISSISNLSNIMYELLSHIEVHMLKKPSILHDYVKKT